MNFFEHQERARRNTWLLVFYFVAAVALIVVAVDLVVLFAVKLQSSDSTYGAAPAQFNPNTVLILTTFGTLALVGLATLWKVSSLSSGGAAVADMMGGTLVSSDTRDPMERRLVNVIEEMALASGISVPAIYVLNSESSINAFAAGNSPSTAAIAVSRGALESLSRDELQGVVAHEFSHVFNGDMRMNLKLMGVLFGILVLAMVGRILLHASGSGRSRRRNGGGSIIVIVGLGLLVIGYIGVFFAQLIKSAISRQREFLADASAVQFTRNPSGLLGALVKIRDGAGSRLENARTEEVSHLLFAQGLASVFATHPPLEKRILAIDPTVHLAKSTGAGERVMPTSLAPEATASHFAPAAGFGSRSTPTAAALASIGQPGTEDLAHATSLLARFPAELRSRLESAEGARAAVYALLLDEEEHVRGRQLDRLEDEAMLTADLHPIVRSLEEGDRLPLVELAAPALRRIAVADRGVFLSRIHTLVVEDRKVEPFELLLELFLEHMLGEHGRSEGVGYRTLRSALPDLRVVLSFLAHAGRPGSPEAERALKCGLDHLGGGIDAALLPESGLGPDVMRLAVSALRVAAAPIRALVMGASAACALSDSEVTLEEWETLRVLGAVLECPLPPAISNLSRN